MKNMRNEVKLLGNLGKDPEIRTTTTGKKYARFSFATPNNYKNAKGDWINETDWHNMVAWGQIASNVEKSLKKGNMVVITGRIKNRTYEDKNGQTRHISEIIINDFDRLIAKKTTSASQDSDGLPF